MADKSTQAEGVTRLAFIKGSAGVAAGAAIVGAPAIALERSVSGTGETTYRDPARSSYPTSSTRRWRICCRSCTRASSPASPI